MICPTPLAAPEPRAVPRRLVLGAAAGGAVAALTGCSSGSLPLISPADPDDQLRRAVAQSEQLLLTAYDTTMAAFPELTNRLRLLRDQHQAHLTAVSDGLDLGSPSPAAPGTAPGGGATGAVRTLRRLEAAAVKQRIQACTAAEAVELAELLARIGASESAHVAALRGGAA